MKLATINTGIGSELVAAQVLDWEIVFAHTDKFTRPVLEKNYPEVPIVVGNLPNANIEIISGRTPGPPRATNRGPAKLDTNYLELALQFFNVASQLSARWVVWETSPRFIRSNKGKDFAEVLVSLGELGYGYSYRVLDAKYFGVPQARRSLFIVGYRGDWRGPAAVLFDQITAKDNSTQVIEKSNTFRTIEELVDADYAVFPHEVVNTGLYKRSPNLPFRKERTYLYRQRNPFLLISCKDKWGRELTHIEWERLQGLCDNYTKVSTPEMKPFSSRKVYGFIGNAGCVPVYIWIYWRLQQVQSNLNQE